MKVQAIASGSNGNCFYLEEGETRVLIDAGISCKRIADSLSAIGVDPQTVSAVLLTHEHCDHTLGLPVLLKKYGMPVYATEGTAASVSLDKGNDLTGYPGFHPVVPFQAFQVGSLRVKPVPTHHDTAAPVFFRLEGNGRNFALMTDTGSVTGEMKECLHDLDGILLESNHDVRMLEMSRYTYALKRRILGEAGHLSNDAALEILGEIISPRMKLILLGHLSEENNYPDLVRVGLKNFLSALSQDRKSPDLKTEIAVRTSSTGVFEI